MPKTVVIDAFPESVSRYRDRYAIVSVDVVRATTTAITAVVCGHRCFPVATVDSALTLAARLDNPLLAGEEQGIMPAGFDMNNSPTELVALSGHARSVVLLSSSGTKLCYEASRSNTAFLACLRNYGSTARHLISSAASVAIIGAGSRGKFREEDQMCCAWIAELLLIAGYQAENRGTLDLVEQWRDQPVDAWISNESAEYLRTTGQVADLKFILQHVNDIDSPFILRGGEVVVCEEHQRPFQPSVYPPTSRWF